MPSKKALLKAAAEKRAEAGRAIVAPTDADSGALGAAVQSGSFRDFRMALLGYEDWLRKRVGRWIERYPEAEARIGNGLAIGDVIEQVYLTAFEQYPHRPTQVSLHEWLDGLIDPALKAMLKDPDAARENASFARTLRQTPE